MKISPMLLPMVIVLVITNNLKIYLIAYLVMIIHELAHLLAAKLIGLKADYIYFSPFGINLKLKNRVMNKLSETIILYCSGPLVNGIIALISIYFHNIVLYRMNISLFIMNLLPIIPLDGGMIAHNILSGRLGNKLSRRILNAFSVLAGITMLIFFVFAIVKGEINISMFIISVFFIGNVLTTKEMYNQDLILSLSNRKKRSNKVKVTIIDEYHSVADVIKELSPAYTLFAIHINNNGKISEILSESEIIEKYYCENLTL